MVIMDLPGRICVRCMGRLQGRSRAEEYLGRVRIDIAGPMQVKSAGGREYKYIVVDDYTRGVYTPLTSMHSGP